MNVHYTVSYPAHLALGDARADFLMTRKKPESRSMRVRMYADDGDEGYLVGLLTLSYEAPAKGRAVSTAT